MKAFARFPTILRNTIGTAEDLTEYELEIFGELKLPWGIEFYIYRIKFTQGENIGIGDVRLLPKEEFNRYFSDFMEISQPDIH